MSRRFRPLLARLVARWVLFVLVTALCWQLRGLRRPGGDTDLMLGKWAEWLGDSRWIFHEREPGAFLIHEAVYRATRDLHLAPVDVYSVSAAFAGGLLIAVVSMVTLHPALYLLLLANGTVSLFLGHAENYSIAFTLAAATLLLAWRHAQHPEATPLWPAVLSWCLAVAFHRVAVLLAPAAIPLLLRRDGWRLRPLAHGRADRAACLLLVIGLCGFYIVPNLMALHPRFVYVVEIHNDLREMITPLTRAQAERIAARSQLGAWFLFTLFTHEHWRHLAYFEFTLAPFGFLSLIALRRGLRGRPAAMLLTAIAVTQIWAVFWHPHGSFADWDLFSFMALPLNLTAGLLWTRAFSERPPTPVGKGAGG